jgi:hypothetical protein
MVWPIKWWYVGCWNDLTTCHILPLIKKINQKHRLGVGQKDHPKVSQKNHPSHTRLVKIDLS